MLRKITPFLILAIVSLIYSIYILITDGQGWGLLVVFALTGIAIAFFIVDLLLKKFILSWKKILWIESGILLILFGLYQYENRPLIFELPGNFSQDYVTVIYDVEDAKDLGINAFTLRKKIQVPNDGIIYTSSGLDENLPETDFKTSSGEYFSSTDNKKMFIKLTNSEFEYNGKKYAFRIWKIAEGDFLVSTSKEYDIYKNILIEAFEKRKASR